MGQFFTYRFHISNDVHTEREYYGTFHSLLYLQNCACDKESWSLYLKKYAS